MAFIDELKIKGLGFEKREKRFVKWLKKDYNYLSNPFDYFVNGSEKKSFTYSIVDKDIPFHIYIGKKSSVNMNLMVFASNVSMAKNILIDAMYFRLQCAKEYVQSRYKEQLNNTQLELLMEEHNIVREVKELLEFIEQDRHEEKYNLIIEPIQTNQFFKIGWASNDNVLS